ncbi:class I SAM-dependent methyltransferase [Methylocapsa sp. S129]|uniref:class I SAM-dependent methyltransferase n=1 Tax=Methylocapsa sp. S129 TaxID=1641869 RepID=UPI00131B5525|nr:class I SAM-dependent methyltransferase [Methylocapsa sp. S129]
MSELENVFEKIMALNRWSGDESRSGPGSTLSYTCNIRNQLEVFVRQFEIKTFFDAPCGDFNWMKEVGFPDGSLYLGGDIANSLIRENVKKYARESRKFFNFDIVADKFPEADVWFCRDCLFHLPDAYIFQALRNFCDSKIKLLMMTNHINATGFRNTDIEAGEFRLVDFYSEPFGLPRDVLFRIADYVHPYPQREMCVWTREQIAAALETRGG